MKSLVKMKLDEFLNSLNISMKRSNNPLSFMDMDAVKENQMFEYLFDKSLRYSKAKKINRAQIIENGSLFKNDLSASEKVMIMLYLIKSIHDTQNNELDQMFEEVVFWAGGALGLEHDEVNEIVDFVLNDLPFADNNLAAYFVNSNTKFSNKHICMKLLTYEKQPITYVKYLKNSQIILSKAFECDNNTFFINEKYSVNKVKVLDEQNYVRSDFGYYTLEELKEALINTNPLQFYELNSGDCLPKVVLDPELNKIIIAGNSAPLAPTNFFNPIIDWITYFKQNNRKELKVYVMLDYFNTYTSKFLMRLTKECLLLSEAGCDTKIYWYFDEDDDDMREFGENLQVIFKRGVEFCYNSQELVA